MTLTSRGICRPTFERHATLGLLGLAVVLAAGWYKSVENANCQQRHRDWNERQADFRRESQADADDFNQWFDANRLASDVRQRVDASFDDVIWRTERDRDVAVWIHSPYRFQWHFDFDGGRLVSAGIDDNLAQFAASNPQPLNTASCSQAESIRRLATRWGVWLWAAMVFITLASRRYRSFAATATLVLAAACGTAWLVNPLYNLTANGILSNDQLFFAVLMGLVSVILAGSVMGLSTTPREFAGPFQFKLRTLLMVTALASVLLAIGPFGYVALGTLCVSTVLFFVSRRVASRIRRAMGLPGDATPAMAARVSGV